MMLKALVKTVTLASTLFLPALPAISSAAIYDDFNLKGWYPASKGTGVSWGPANDRLEFNFSADAKNDPALKIFGASYVSSCHFTGDFDVQVQYMLIDYPANNGVRVSLGLGYSFLADSGLPGNIGVAAFGARDDVAGGKGYFTDTESGISIKATTDTTGYLKLTRQGSVLTGYYYDAATQEWVMVGSSPTSMREASFYIGAWSHDAYFGDKPVKIAFDNVSINQGNCVDPYATKP